MACWKCMFINLLALKENAVAGMAVWIDAFLRTNDCILQLAQASLLQPQTESLLWCTAIWIQDAEF